MNPNYPGANRSQWFAGKFPGASMTPNVIVLHTTEGSGWPGYEGGGTAPHLTIRPDTRRKRLDVRQHLPLDRSARALRNKAGGVETNTLNCVQLELVGTCDPRQRGRGMMFWPEAPAWALEQLGDVLAELHELHPAIPLHSSVPFRPYPSSYGEGASQRLSAAGWRRFRGVCGHQHVPENDHGDPGALPIGKIIMHAHARGPSGTTTLARAKQLLYVAASRSGPFRKRAIVAAIKILPRK